MANPHKQLKTIRAQLGLTQKAAAAKLGVSYPYFLSVETGQRDLSKSLEAKIWKTFGVERIGNKDDYPLIRGSQGKLVPFTREEYLRYASSRPSFWIGADYAGPEGPHKITPTLEDYARCTHALFAAAEEEGTLRPILADFFSWFARSITTDSAYEKLREIFERLYPGERSNSDAFLALTLSWGFQVENEVFKNQERKAKATARASAKRKKKRGSLNHLLQSNCYTST